MYWCALVSCMPRRWSAAQTLSKTTPTWTCINTMKNGATISKANHTFRGRGEVGGGFQCTRTMNSAPGIVTMCATCYVLTPNASNIELCHYISRYLYLRVYIYTSLSLSLYIYIYMCFFIHTRAHLLCNFWWMFGASGLHLAHVSCICSARLETGCTTKAQQRLRMKSNGGIKVARRTNKMWQCTTKWGGGGWKSTWHAHQVMGILSKLD